MAEVCGDQVGGPDALQARAIAVRSRSCVKPGNTGPLGDAVLETRLQFLRAGLTRPERRLEPTTLVSGLRIASLGDLLAMKLNAIAGRAQLRDYFDRMTIELQGGRTIEEGLGLFLARYQPDLVAAVERYGISRHAALESPAPDDDFRSRHREPPGLEPDL